DFMSAEKIRLFVVVITITILSSGAFAQQAKNDRPGSTNSVDASKQNSADTPKPAGSDSPEFTERERMLLDRIEKLERRLAEIESRNSRSDTSSSSTREATSWVLARPAGASGD